MKFFIVCITLLLAACNNGMAINASSMKTANTSVKIIKERLPGQQRVEYELSFWTLRSEFSSDTEFLKQIDGKTPEQLIELGKASFNRRKAEGLQEYQAYNDWQSMLDYFRQARDAQSKASKDDEKDKNYKHSVLYKL